MAITDKKLILELKKLKNIQPSESWVVLTKKQIVDMDSDKLEEGQGRFLVFANFIKELQRGERFLFNHKLAFSSVLMVVVFLGLFGFAQNSVPGDSLFAIKRMAEKSQSVFTKDKISYNFDIANKRLDDLTKIAETNSVNNLSSAIIEYNEAVSKATEEFAQSKDRKEIGVEIKIKDEIKKLKDKEDVLRTYGIEIDSNDRLDDTLAIIEDDPNGDDTTGDNGDVVSATGSIDIDVNEEEKELVKRELDLLKEKELTEKQKEELLKAEEKYEQGDYQSAIEIILLIDYIE